ncbi:flavin reductase family protein [Amycolatopsis magusensis]|uniref:flavin reductase family protein n=1 Tax=Amycolatopsis magusensis TaxID=882444 RepID=UPI0024A7B8E2|nr:flavin reductase family protein [Amycolatopsis magusensis]MDI5978869.1 flavin reductase family protein [Amycolatopsis magusensis]
MSSHAAPPARLGQPLELDPGEWTRAAVYDLVTALVLPRPVAWVSTVSAGGARNLAPHSYFTLVSDHPAHVAFSSIGVKDTLRNIRATGEFVVNFAGQHLLAALDKTAADVPPEHDEFTLAGLTPEPSHRVRPPRVAEARAHFECVLRTVLPVGNGNLVIGEVVHVHVCPSIWAGGRVDTAVFDPVVRLSRRYGVLAKEFTAEEEPSPHVLTS